MAILPQVDKSKTDNMENQKQDEVGAVLSAIVVIVAVIGMIITFAVL
jgi:hypothetical protein